MALFRKREQGGVARSSLLSARPVANPEVVCRDARAGAIELSVPMPKGRVGRWLSRSDAPMIRRFELDELGREVWCMVGERLTVREMIERFAREHKLNLREAEVALISYLRTLASRRIIALAPAGAWECEKVGT